MGTNFYLVDEEAAEEPHEDVHLGKRTGGYLFSINVYAVAEALGSFTDFQLGRLRIICDDVHKLTPTALEQLRLILGTLQFKSLVERLCAEHPTKTIVDEYGTKFSVEQLLEAIDGAERFVRKCAGEQEGEFCPTCFGHVGTRHNCLGTMYGIRLGPSNYV